MIRTANIYKVNLEEVSLLQRAELPKIDPESSAHLVCAKSYNQNKKWRESTMKLRVGAKIAAGFTMVLLILL